MPNEVELLDENDEVTYYSIDGVDDQGNYTEAIWDYYDGKPMTKEMALQRTPEFAFEHSIPDGPIIFYGEPVLQKEL